MINKLIGERIRQRRVVLRMTQTQVSEHLGISYQQLQKYEKGVDRLSADKLYILAKLLGVKITFFYEDMDNMLASPNQVDLVHYAQERQKHQPDSAELVKLAKAYSQIENTETRETILGMISALTLDDDQH